MPPLFECFRYTKWPFLVLCCYNEANGQSVISVLKVTSSFTSIASGIFPRNYIEVGHANSEQSVQWAHKKKMFFRNCSLMS
jgi:hypothetical protein